MGGVKSRGKCWSCPACYAPALSQGRGKEMADLDDLEFALGEVSEKLSSIHETLHEMKEGGTGRTWGEWIGILFVVFLFSGWSGSAVDRWTDKVWYSLVDNADLKNITVSKRPPDCDFFHAPIGDKG